MDHLPDVRLGRATSFQKRFESSSVMAVYGVPLLVPGALRRSTATGTEVDVKAMIDHMQTNAAKEPPSTTPFQYDVRFPESAARATHVYVKIPKKGLGPLMAGPYPIVERRGKSILLVNLGKDASGNDRHKIYHWANCQPAILAPDAKIAEAPRRGRPKGATAKVPAETEKEQPPDDPVGDQPPENDEQPNPVPTTTKSGRTSKPPQRYGCSK